MEICNKRTGYRMAPSGLLDYSLILPSRGRHAFLLRTIETFYKLAQNQELIETILIIDEDDKDSKEFISSNIVECYPNIIVKARNRGESIVRDYYNYGAQFCRGNYIWQIGNDLEMQTKDWDIIIKERIEKYLSNKLDRLVYVATYNDLPNDHFQKHGAAAFPILTKEVYNLFGWVVPPELKFWGADIALWDIWVPTNRILDCRDVIFFHYCFHNGRALKDEITERAVGAKPETNPRVVPARKYTQMIVNEIDRVRRVTQSELEVRS